MRKTNEAMCAWRRPVAGAALLALLLLPAAGPAAEVELAGGETPWRAFLVSGPKLDAQGDGFAIMDRRERRNPVPFDPATNAAHFAEIFSPLPDADWTALDFDDSYWARYVPEDLEDFLGDYGLPVWMHWGGGTWPALLCLRTRFGIDPRKEFGFNLLAADE